MGLKHPTISLDKNLQSDSLSLPHHKISYYSYSLILALEIGDTSLVILCWFGNVPFSLGSRFSSYLA